MLSHLLQGRAADAGVGTKGALATPAVPAVAGQEAREREGVSIAEDTITRQNVIVEASFDVMVVTMPNEAVIIEVDAGLGGGVGAGVTGTGCTGGLGRDGMMTCRLEAMAIGMPSRIHLCCQGTEDKHTMGAQRKPY